MEADRNISEFNMAVSWLNRLNYYFYVCDEAAQNLQLFEWFQSLMILNRELCTEMKKDEEKTQQQQAEELFKEINILLKNQNRKGQTGIPPTTYWKLHKFETSLRKIMDKSGLLKRVQDDAMKSLR